MPRRPRSPRPVRRLVRPHAVFAAVVVVALTFGGAQLSGRAAPPRAMTAQDATPETEDATALDLAAATLDAADLPEGARLTSERYIPRAEQGVYLSAEEVEETGLIGFYESSYSLPDSQLTIRGYAEEYEDAAGAERGFALLEDESGLPDGASQDRPVDGVEGDDEEVTTVDFDAGGGFRIQGVDATVRLGRTVAGVAMENYGGTEAPDADLVDDLIVTVAERLEAVSSGEDVAGRDVALPGALLTATEDEPLTIEGYLAPAEVVPDALGDARDAVVGAYGRTAGIRFANATETPPVLFVNLALVSFDDTAAAEQTLYALDGLTLPSVLPPPLDSFRQQATTPAISEVDAFAETWRAFLPGGPIDSVRLGFVLGERLAIVEVAGGATLNAAHDAAVLIAEAQRDCLLDGDVCGEALPVGDIQDLALNEAEPIAPVDGADADRQATFDAVWNEINDRYLYRTGRQNVLFPNYHELDWGAVRAEYERDALAADTDEEFYGIVAAMVDELGDQHTGFLSPEDTEINAALFAGELMYAGIGVDLAGADLILQVFPGSPAEEAGLQRRDRIEAVDGDPLPFDDLVALREVVEGVNRLLAPSQIPDDMGGPLTLTVRSPGEEPRDVEVERDTGDAPIVPSGMRLPRDEGIGYLVVPDFVAPDLQERVIEILDDMLAEGPLDGLVLDLRANPGGSVALLETFLGLFVEGDVGTFYSRDGQLPAPILVDAQPMRAELDDVPLVVLTDDRMYSASEVGTAVLQDQGRATVVGVTSPGDVEVLRQSFYEDGSSLYIVLGVFALPGSLVEGVGNIPDVPVLLDWTTYPFADDPQIQAGIETIRAGDAPTGTTE